MDVGDLQRLLPEGFTVSEPTPGLYRADGPLTPQVVATITTWCAGQGAMPEELSTGGGSLAEAYFEITSRATPPGSTASGATTPGEQASA
jgi:ABC-2 type transport system ATP-binding protein